MRVYRDVVFLLLLASCVLCSSPNVLSQTSPGSAQTSTTTVNDPFGTSVNDSFSLNIKADNAAKSEVSVGSSFSWLFGCIEPPSAHYQQPATTLAALIDLLKGAENSANPDWISHYKGERRQRQEAKQQLYGIYRLHQLAEIVVNQQIVGLRAQLFNAQPEIVNFPDGATMPPPATPELIDQEARAESAQLTDTWKKASVDVWSLKQDIDRIQVTPSDYLQPTASIIAKLKILKTQAATALAHATFVSKTYPALNPPLQDSAQKAMTPCGGWTESFLADKNNEIEVAASQNYDDKFATKPSASNVTQQYSAAVNFLHNFDEPQPDGTERRAMREAGETLRQYLARRSGLIGSVSESHDSSQLIESNTKFGAGGYFQFSTLQSPEQDPAKNRLMASRTYLLLSLQAQGIKIVPYSGTSESLQLALYQTVKVRKTIGRVQMNLSENFSFPVNSFIHSSQGIVDGKAQLCLTKRISLTTEETYNFYGRGLIGGSITSQNASLATIGITYKFKMPSAVDFTDLSQGQTGSPTAGASGSNSGANLTPTSCTQ